MKLVKHTQHQLVIISYPISGWLSSIIFFILGFFLPFPYGLIYFSFSFLFSIFADTITCSFNKTSGLLSKKKQGLRGTRITRLPLDNISSLFMEKYRMKNGYAYRICFSLYSLEEFVLIDWTNANFKKIHESACQICKFLDLPPYTIIKSSTLSYMLTWLKDCFSSFS